MLKKILQLSVKCLGVLHCLVFSTAVSAAPIVMSYWENWSTYQNNPMPNNAQGSHNTVLTQQLKGINTLAYAFFTVGDDGSLQFSDIWSDLDPQSEQDRLFCNASPSSCSTYPQKAGLGNFSAFIKTPVKYHFISVGGAGQDRAFEKALEHPEAFVASVKILVDIYHIDGLDLDYEPLNGVPTAYIQRFIDLTRQIKSALPSLTLSYALMANTQNIEKFGVQNWKKLEENLDYISIMGYDLHGAFDHDNPLTALHSALLTPDNGYSIENTLMALNKVGIPNNKIILGMPLYGRAVGGVNAEGLGQRFTLGVKGDLDNNNCSIQLNAQNLCQGIIQYKTLVNPSYTPMPVIVTNLLSGVYAYNPRKKIFVSYDNAESASTKARYAIDHHLAGVMFWALRFDTPIDHPESIVGAVARVFGLNDNNG